MTFHVGPYFEDLITWLKVLPGLFDAIRNGLGAFIDGFEVLLGWPPAWVMIAVLTGLAWWACGWRNWGLALFALLELLVLAMELWAVTMQTLALVLTSTLVALLIGVPLNLFGPEPARRADRAVRSGFHADDAGVDVYLIPSVLFFQLGKVPRRWRR